MKNIKIKNIILILLFIITISLLMFSLYKPFYSPVQLDNSKENGSTIGIIKDDLEIVDTFKSKIDILDTIKISFANYGNKIKSGKLLVKVYDYNDKLIYLNEYNIKDLSDNSDLIFEFNPIKNSYNKEFKIILKIDDISKDGITFYSGDGKSNIEFNSKKNSKNNLNGDLLIKQFGEKKNHFYTIVIYFIGLIEIFIFIQFMNIKKNIMDSKKIKKVIIFISILLSIVTAILLIKIDIRYNNEQILGKIVFPMFILTSYILAVLLSLGIKSKNIKLEELFLLLAIPIGALYMYAIPMGETPDEEFHMIMVEQVGTGNSDLRDNKYPQQFDERTRSYETLYDMATNKIKTSETKLTYVDGGYPLLLYIFSGFGNFVGHLFNLNSVQTYYIAIFMNYLLYLISGYLIIKFLPFGKYMGIIYLLNPMYLQQATSVSADAVINASCLLFISYILHLKFNNVELKTKQFIFLLILSLFVIISKWAYFFLLLLLILIRKNLLEYLKKHKISSIIIMVMWLSFLCFYYWFMRKSFLTDYQIEKKIIDGITVPQNEIGKIPYTLMRFENIGYIIIATMKKYLDFYVYTFSGQNLGWFEYSMPSYLSIIFYIGLVVTYFFDNKSIILQKKEKIIILITIILNFAAVIGGLYIGWGNTRDLYVEGVQGRYFIPFAILIPMLMNSNKVKFEIENKKIITCIIVLIINIVTIYHIIGYF